MEKIREEIEGNVEKEVKSVEKYWKNAIRGGNFSLFSLKRDRSEDRKVQKLLKALDLPLYVTYQELIATLKSYETREMPSFVSDSESESTLIRMHREILQAERSEVKGIEGKITREREEMGRLEKEEVQVWEKQPAQYLVPWCRDKEGMNLQEVSEVWRTQVMNMD